MVGIQCLGTQQSDLLTGGKDKLHGDVGQVVFTNNMQSLNQGGNAGFIVTAKNGIAKAGKDIVFADNPDAGSRFHCIQMTAKKHRLPVKRSIKTKNQVTTLGAGLTGRIVFKGRGGIKTAEHFCQQSGHTPFLT